MKILIVDDNEDYRRLLRDTFTDRGWSVVDAPDGCEGLRLIRDERPDVVLSDILMPHMDGFQFLREVSKSDLLRDLVFIFYTSAFEKPQHEEFGLSLGADAYIVRPLDPEKIVTAVQELLERGKTWPASRDLPSEEEFVRRHSLILSESLYEKVLDLSRERDVRLKAEAELERLRRKIEGHPVRGDISGLAACPFAVSEDINGPVVRIVDTCSYLTKRRGIDGNTEAAEAIRKICSLTEKMRSLLQDLLRFTVLPRNVVLAPAKAISSLLEHLARYEKDEIPGIRSDLAAIAEDVKTYTDHVDDLIRAAVAWRSPVRKTSVDVSGMVHEVCEELRATAPEREAQFLIRENLTGIADESMLRLALRELLDNAWKFSSKNPAAKVEFGTTAIENKSVFFVRDNGVGFDMKCADGLFTAFRRLHSKEEFPGNGIGLVIVKGVVSRHGGTVWGVGEPGNGATFYFTLYKM